MCSKYTCMQHVYWICKSYAYTEILNPIGVQPIDMTLEVSMQQGGSSASDSRPVPPEECYLRCLLGRSVVIRLHSWQQDKEEIIEPECVIEKVEIPKAEVRDSDWTR